MPLESIRSLVKDDLSATDRFIITELESQIPLISQILEYILSSGGKRIRPMIVLLSARALSEHAQKHIDLAAVIELIHTATLLHDDVVDSSTLRRGQKTANTIWGNDASVLVGDFLYSRAFQMVVAMNNQRCLETFAQTTHYIAEGEILQLVNRHNPDTTEDFYYEVIKRKTAKLFEIAAQLAAILTSPNENDIEALRLYGFHLGLAYQLIDDAIDYSGTAEEAGKSVGQDISEGKTTLPLIHAMRVCTGADLKTLRDAIKSGTSKNMPAILQLIESTGAIQYTADNARKHAEKAKEALAHLPVTPYRQALESLSDFVVMRSY